MRLPSGREAYRCSDCLLIPGEYWTDSNFSAPRLDKALEANPPTQWLVTGRITIGDFTAPVWSEFILCPKHQPASD